VAPSITIIGGMDAMGAEELSLRRSQMGHAAVAMLRGGPKPCNEEGEGYWLAQSGVASVDMNMALVSSGGPEEVDKVLALVTQSEIPTLFMVADSSPSLELEAPWQFVGETPFMASSLGSKHLRADPRVREAGPDDAGIVFEVMGEAFGIDGDLFSQGWSAVFAEGSDESKVWLLFDDGVCVSAVLTFLVGDAVSVWCMATPSRFGRRGYGKAILAHALLAAKSEGALVGLLGATPAGKPLYDSTGWSTVEHWRMYATVTSAQFH